MRINLWLVLLATIALSGSTFAGPGDSGSSSSNPLFSVHSPGQRLASPSTCVDLAPPVSAHAPLFVDRVRYRPRIRRAPRAVTPLAAQVHIGFFEPIDNFSMGFNGGFRVGPRLDPHIQIGFAMDWWRRSDDKVLDLGTGEAPGGVARQELILSESTANLVPIMLFMQVSGDERMSVIPHGGIGIGHEWLFLSAYDHVTRESFDQTFGGLGWQVWVGAALPVDYRTRVNAEVFFNGCEVASDVDVYIRDYGPATVRNVIKMNGVGMRFGFSWMF